MSYIPNIPQQLTFAGGLLATTAALVAETVSSDPTVGAGSFLLGGAGLIAAISAFTKDFWQDRQKQREHELAKLRLRGRNDRTAATVDALLDWVKAARSSIAALPPAPNVHLQSDSENDV